ncbi:MAG: NUDIX domain-containing protein, partial [bacterium]|nr:NUDIX domain-containing protein [bacterium]
ISLWIKERKIEFAYKKRLALQYSSYIHNGKETIKKLKENSWVIEAKYEDLGKMTYSENNKNRIRISFFIENQDQLQNNLNTISFICNNKNYAKEVNDVFAWFSENHFDLVESIDKKVLEGTWSEDSRWEFFLSSTLPNKELCTAVFGIPKVRNGFLLTKTIRGWELPGRNIEENEEIIEALKREVSEEVGYITQRAVLYGYRKIITSKILYNKKQNPYPYPISYIPHFLVGSDLGLEKPTGQEVLENGFFVDESKEIENSHIKEIIKIGIKELNRIS